MGHVWVGRRRDILRFALFLVVALGLVLVVRAGIDDFPQTTPAATAAPAAGPAVPVAAANTAAPGGFFSEFRLERDRSRSAQQEVIREVLAGASADPAVRQDANNRYLWLGKAAALESETEGLIRGLGYGDAVVFLSEGSAQVIVKAAELQRPQVAQIADVVARTTGVLPQHITIRPLAG